MFVKTFLIRLTEEGRAILNVSNAIAWASELNKKEKAS